VAYAEMELRRGGGDAAPCALHCLAWLGSGALDSAPYKCAEYPRVAGVMNHRGCLCTGKMQRGRCNACLLTALKPSHVVIVATRSTWSVRPQAVEDQGCHQSAPSDDHPRRAPARGTTGAQLPPPPAQQLLAARRGLQDWVGHALGSAQTDAAPGVATSPGQAFKSCSLSARTDDQCM
jgi:hypothetical protein